MRPYSKFYTLEALRRYKWYWRLEPDVEFSCSITYDPFVKMAKHKQVYGWTMSLWEEGNTCPSLFRHMADWKEANLIPTTSLWKAMMSASWLPYPFRSWLSWLPHHDKLGDVWSMCHYWSNFEIADLDFFRSKSYQDLFNYLDQKEGFYHERVRRIFPTPITFLLRLKHANDKTPVGRRCRPLPRARHARRARARAPLLRLCLPPR